MKKSIYFILICLLLFCTFYGIRYVKSPVATQTAVTEVYENKVVTAGYIVKTEQVYNAAANGAVYHYLQEGTRVKKNNVLSTVYTGEESEKTLAELNNVNKKIAELESSGDMAYTLGASSEENIEIIKDNIIKSKNTNDLSKISDYKAQIKSIVTGNLQDIQTEDLSSLASKKQTLEASIQTSRNDIYSQMSGVFSKNIDGLEGILMPETILTYKVADYEKLTIPSERSVDTVVAGNPVCKVVNNHIWYTMTVVDSETAKEISKGQKVKMRFDKLPGIEADGIVEYISDEDSTAKKNVVVIKSEQYKEGVFSVRYSGIELILESYQGYRVPVSAIHIVDGQKGVMIRNALGDVFRKCNVIYTDTVGQTVIIAPASGGSGKTVSEYDNIIIGEK